LARKGLRAVFHNIEVRHLHAVIVLAEELNFTRAALRLRISQPALSKQITELEEENRFQLFARDKRRSMEITDAGCTFVEEARLALLHAERAVHLARVVHQGSDQPLMIGEPFSDQSWISAILTLHVLGVIDSEVH
jgi:DNA-binding transcriptional LysR family regulator